MGNRVLEALVGVACHKIPEGDGQLQPRFKWLSVPCTLLNSCSDALQKFIKHGWLHSQVVDKSPWHSLSSSIMRVWYWPNNKRRSIHGLTHQRLLYRCSLCLRRISNASNPTCCYCSSCSCSLIFSIRIIR